MWNGSQNLVRIVLHFAAVGLQGCFQDDVDLVTDRNTGTNVTAIR